MDLDQDFALARLGHRRVLVSQDLRTAVFVDAHCFHRRHHVPPEGSHERRARRAPHRRARNFPRVSLFCCMTSSAQGGTCLRPAHKFVPTLALLACLLGGAALADQLMPLGDGWQTYVNDRFGMRFDYPADLFTPDAAARERRRAHVFRPERASADPCLPQRRQRDTRQR